MNSDSHVATSQVNDDRLWYQWYEPNVPYDVSVPSMPLHELLSQTAQRFPTREAVHFMGNGIQYRQLNEMANRFANWLIQLNVQPGDRVALLLPNCPQFVIAYYGGVRAGAIVCPANPTYTEEELRVQLEDSGAKTVVCLSMLYNKLASIQEDLPGLKHVIVTNIKEYLPFVTRTLFTFARERREGHHVDLPDDSRHHWWNDVLDSGGEHDPAIPTQVDEIAALQYTAGTTGTPKGVMLTHRNLLVGAEHARLWLINVTAEEQQDSILGVIPLFHTYAQTTVMNYAVLVGGRSILQPRFDVKDVLTAINQVEPGFLPGVPSMYRVLADARDVNKYDLQSLKACISGSAPLTEKVQTRFEELSGARLVEGYGLTEAPVTHCNPIQGNRRIGTIGIPVPGTDAAVFDLETGTRQLGNNEPGELAVRGPQVMKGYWNRPEEMKKVLRDGWLFTGDIAERDDEGFFRIVDRKKEIIIVGGLNVFPSEVEDVVNNHPGVSESVAIGIPDEYRGEAVKLFVVPEEGVEVTERDLITFLRERVAQYKVPKAIEFRSELPKSLIGKILRRKLSEEARQKRDQQARD
jgi:long-chain acyl-CoA synthetase